MSAFIDWLRGAAFKYGGSMIMEPNGEAGKYVASLGRAMLLGLLVLAGWSWLHDRDIAGSHERVLFALMAYTFGSKAVQTAKDFAAMLAEAKAALPQPTPSQPSAPQQPVPSA